MNLALAAMLLLVKPVEVGIQITGTHLHKIDEAPIGIGGRFFLNFTNAVAVDAELTKYRTKTSVLAGLKAGWRAKRVGVFGKGRTGLWHFDDSLGSVRAMDMGGVLEYYPSTRTTIRIDLGDTMLFYRPARLGTVHNFQPGLGMSFRF